MDAAVCLPYGSLGQRSDMGFALGHATNQASDVHLVEVVIPEVVDRDATHRLCLDS